MVLPVRVRSKVIPISVNPARWQTSASAPAGADADEGDPFIAIIKKYASVAMAEAQQLKDLLDEVDASYKALLAYLKIKPGKGQVQYSLHLLQNHPRHPLKWLCLAASVAPLICVLTWRTR